MYRVGIGYDIHRLEKGRRLILGAVEIEFDYGLKGHSDGDALLHSISDAILGATGKLDIGNFFPDSDEKIKNISSTKILKFVFEKIKQEGYRIFNLDSVIIAQKPKINNYIEKMKKNISEILNLQINKIGIKAKTNEGCDEIGKGNAIAVHSVVLLQKGCESKK